MPKKLTFNDFVEKSKSIHGEKYDYSKVDYKNNSTKVLIICPRHGEFLMRPADHFNGQGCPKCKSENLSNKFSMGKEAFIKKALSVHENKYDYSKVEYKNNRTKVCIICPEHGEFWQTPDKHITGQGCPKCCRKNRRYTTEEFIEKARSIHGEKYDYSKTVYGENDKQKVVIICPEHGEFEQTPLLHLSGCGCKYCNKGNVFNTQEFIKMANIVHKNKYEYSKTEYRKSLQKVCIICPEHGEFWQTPAGHLSGKGCPICAKKFRKGEIALFEELKSRFPLEKIVHSYRNKSILGKQELDIYFPLRKIGIEFQGGQHFFPVDFGGYGENISKEIFENNKKRDIAKKEKCNKNGIVLLYFSDVKCTNFLNEKIYSNYDEISAAIDAVIKKEDEKQ